MKKDSVTRDTSKYVGTIRTWKDALPVEMWFQGDGDIQIQIKGQYRQLLNGIRIGDGNLRGSFLGDIGTADANRHRYNLHLKLKLRSIDLTVQLLQVLSIRRETYSVLLSLCKNDRVELEHPD